MDKRYVKYIIYIMRNMKTNKTKKIKKIKKMKGGGPMLAAASMMGGPGGISTMISPIIKTVATEIINLATEIGKIGKNNMKESIDMKNKSAKELIDIAKKAAMEIINHSKSTLSTPNATPAITSATTPATTPATNLVPNKQTGGNHKSHKSHKNKFRKTRNRPKHSLNKKH